MAMSSRNLDRHFLQTGLILDGLLLFRYVDGGNFYRFAIRNDGAYRLSAFVNKTCRALIPWTDSDAIETGEQAFNILFVLARGPKIVLLANDTVLAQIGDAIFSHVIEGVFGLAFDDVAVWNLAKLG